MLRPGDPAPEVVLPDQHGQIFRLSALQGKGPAVVYFYPKDETMVCTKEACLFRDDHHAFVGLGATVIGISADDVASHLSFAERHRLPFILLSDPDDIAFGAFGLRTFIGLKQRASFVLDDMGIIRAATSSPLNAGKHVREALAALQGQDFSKV